MTDTNETMMEDATDRDPRQAPLGIFTGGSFVLDSSRVFCWFASVESLVKHLSEELPAAYDFDDEEAAAYLQKLTPLLAELKSGGFSESLRSRINEAVKDSYVIDWWGEFSELVANQSGFAQSIASGFLEEDETARPIAEDELDDFIDYLKTCAV